jgi:hypothetical protein
LNYFFFYLTLNSSCEKGKDIVWNRHVPSLTSFPAVHNSVLEIHFVISYIDKLNIMKIVSNISSFFLSHMSKITHMNSCLEKTILSDNFCINSIFNLFYYLKKKIWNKVISEVKMNKWKCPCFGTTSSQAYFHNNNVWEPRFTDQ